VPLDQRIDEPQGLTFTTPEVKAPLRLAGPSEFRFWAITEGSDMAWIARLADVAPDGSATLITQGWLRASFRRVDESRSRPGDPYLPDDRDTPVTTGETIEYRLPVWDTAYTLAPGHRLRLWLSSSDAPTHEPLPVAGRNLILHDADHPSQLLLGVRDAKDACSKGPETCPDLPAEQPPPARAGGRACHARKALTVTAPHGLRRVSATVGGRRARMRHGRLVVRPRTGATRVGVRFRGTDRRGRRVMVTRRYAFCRS
jgi:hypothetical protein